MVVVVLSLCEKKGSNTHGNVSFCMLCLLACLLGYLHEGKGCMRVSTLCGLQRQWTDLCSQNSSLLSAATP